MRRPRSAARAAAALAVAASLSLPTAALGATVELPRSPSLPGVPITAVVPDSPYATGITVPAAAPSRARAALPARFSLVEQGLSTRVKNQGYFGTCWAFGDLATAESSLILQGRATAQTADLSELQVAWFRAWTATAEEAAAMGAPGQEGEGIVNTAGDGLDAGGMALTTLAVTTRGTGLVDESVAPYRPQEPVLLPGTMPWRGEEVPIELWDPFVPWDLDRSLALRSDYQVASLSLLPAPMDTGTYDPDAVRGVKEELLRGQTVTVSYSSGAALLGEMGADNPYLNEETGGFYIGTESDVDHVVTIVGWDDAFPVEAFGDTAETRPPAPLTGAATRPAARRFRSPVAAPAAAARWTATAPLAVADAAPPCPGPATRVRRPCSSSRPQPGSRPSWRACAAAEGAGGLPPGVRWV